jgi:hypothetical protein
LESLDEKLLKKLGKHSGCSYIKRLYVVDVPTLKKLTPDRRKKKANRR